VLVAANIKVVKRLLASRFTVVSALVTPEWLAKLEPQLRARPEDIRVLRGGAKLLETITGYKMHQGALAVARFRRSRILEPLLKQSPRPLLLAAVEGSRARRIWGVVRWLRGVWRAYPHRGRNVRASASAPRGGGLDGDDL